METLLSRGGSWSCALTPQYSPADRAAERQVQRFVRERSKARLRKSGPHAIVGNVLGAFESAGAGFPRTSPRGRGTQGERSCHLPLARRAAGRICIGHREVC